MDVSGGRGQPQPGNDESAEHTGPEAPAPGDAPTHPAPPSTPTPADEQGARPEGPEPGADAPASEGGDESQEIVPNADPPLPRSDEAKTLLPTAWTLAYITVPLSLVAGFGTLAALLGIGATRHTRRTVRTREQ